MGRKEESAKYDMHFTNSNPETSTAAIDRNRQKIIICLASDDRYACYMGLTMLSILKSADSEDVHKFYLLSNAISDTERAKIENLKYVRPFELVWIPITSDQFEGCKFNPETLAITTYARFLIPQLIEEEKVLYLDCDLYIRHSLYPLFTTPIDNQHAAAVLDYGIHPDYIADRFNGEVSPDQYVNAGVMLINNKLWRDDSIMEKLFDYAREYSHRFAVADQDCINYILRNSIKIVDFRWNVVEWTYDPMIFLWLKSRSAIQNAGKDPFIRHFKPWKENFSGHFKPEYIDRIMKGSAWENHIPKDDFSIKGWTRHIRSFIKKYPSFITSRRFYLRLFYWGFKKTITRQYA